MLGHQKGFSTAVVLFAVVTLLSPASSFFLPRVSRTNDAIVIDFEGVGYAPSHHGKSLYDEIASPSAFLPVPSVYPYPMMYRQQQKRPNGWSYSFSHPIVNSSNRQVAIAAAATTTTTPAPAIQCGKGPSTLPSRSSIGQRVSGGGATPPASSNNWLFLVTLKMDDADPGVYFCSGTLISDSKVLLAASCLEGLSLNKMSQVTVLIGLRAAAAGATDTAPKVQMTRRISKVAIHIKFNALTYANDIAILTLEYPVALSNFMVPVCLPPASTEIDQYVDQDAVIIGWGTEDGSASTALKQGKVTVSSYDVCNADENFGSFVSLDTNFCISAADKFVCKGDVGGPVLVLTPAGTWTQIGINSYTPEGCTANSLQTRVSAFKAWIDTYIKN